VFATTGNDEEAGRENPAVIITPGAEVARLETRVATDPSDVDSMIVLAEVLSNSGRISESVRWFERALEVRPDDVPLRVAFAQALQRNQSYFDAEVQYRRALEVDPEYQAAAFYLASLYEELPSPRTDDAVNWYQRCIDIDPDSVIAGQARDRLTALTGSGSPAASPEHP
jgi:cytochrome c-type biogenesis protein CcmH/NrfG